VSMDPNVKAKWVAALRSGDYKQGRGHLVQDVWSEVAPIQVDHTEYCCLGVLQCLSVSDPDMPYLESAEGVDILDPDDAMQVGLQAEEQHLLAAKNDGSHYQGVFFDPCNFGEIADYIEENL